MAAALSSAVQEALAAGRDRLNESYVAAWRATGVDAAACLDWVREGVAPAVDAAADRDPGSAPRVLEALFDLSLPLLAQRVLGAGARHPAVSDGWTALLPGLPALLVADPAALAATVVNALQRLATTPGARPRAWVESMLRAGPRCVDLERFREAGLVAAWRCGLAQFRLRALALASRMDAALVAPLLELADADPARLRALLDGAAADPWLSLDELLEGPWGEPRLALVARAGSFRGFGGLFPVPPRVAARGGALYAHGGGCWRIFADCYGVVFVPADPPPEDAPPARSPEIGLTPEGAVRFRGLSGAFPALAGATSCASDGVTLAVTLATSHAVCLVARR